MLQGTPGGGLVTPRDCYVLLISRDRHSAHRISRDLAVEDGWNFHVQWCDAAEPLPRQLADGQYDLTLLDVTDSKDGLSEVQQFLERSGPTPVVVIGKACGALFAQTAVGLGAEDCLTASQLEHGALARALAFAVLRQESLRRRHPRDETPVELIQQLRQQLAQLTARERQVAELLVEHKNIKAIAARLGTSHHTVRNQRASILKKMACDTVAQLVARLVRLPKSPDDVPDTSPSAGIDAARRA